MAKIFNLFRRKRAQLERDLDRELRHHLDLRVGDLMKDGLSETDARRRANIEFGAVTQVQEEVRETWTWRWLDILVADVRYSLRALAKSWGFSLGTIAVLGLGIGATVAIFSVVNAVVLRPLPYPNAERIVSVETFWSNTGQASQNVSGPDFLDWKARSNVFEKMAAFYGNDDAVTIVNDRAVFANARYVAADFFAVFGQTAALGRLLTERDVPPGESEPTVAVVGQHWAVANFGSASAAVGKIISVYGSPLEIVGVSAPEFRYPGATDIWVPWRVVSSQSNRGDYSYQAVGRLASGVSLARAQAAMRSVGDNMARQYAENRFTTVAVTPLQERIDRQRAGDVVGFALCRDRRVAHRVRQHLEPAARACFRENP